MFRARRLKVLTALAVVLGAASVSAQDPPQPPRTRLDGLWEFTVVNLTPAGFLPDPLIFIGNLTRDGSFLNESSLPESGVPITGDFGTPCCLFRLSAGHGQWIRTEPRTFVLETWRLVFATEAYQNLTGGLVAAGTFVGYARGQSDVRLDKQGDKLVGKAQFQLMDTNKQPLAPPAVGDVTGKRVPMVPIPVP
jgi:hypothetical protein